MDADGIPDNRIGAHQRARRYVQQIGRRDQARSGIHDRRPRPERAYRRITPAQMTTGAGRDDLSRRLAGAGLNTQLHVDPPCRVSDDAWSAVLRELIREKLTGFALAACEEGWLKLEEIQVRRLVAEHRKAMTLSLLAECELVLLSETFREAGVPIVVLKGPVLAHQFYPDPTLRPFVDLDLLVKTSDWRRACDVLSGAGYVRLTPEPGAGFDERFGKAATHARESGAEVDLHRTLVVGPYGLWIDPEELMASTVPLHIANRHYSRLDDTALLLHQCMHAVLGEKRTRLLPLRDIAQILRRGNIDWLRLTDWAQRWRLEIVFSQALRLLAETLNVGPPREARHWLRTPFTGRDRRLLRAYTSDKRDRGGTAITTVYAINGLRPRLAYIKTMLYPHQEFLAARVGRGRRAFLHRLIVPIRWLARKARVG
jgi:hypothetical protein